VNVKYFLEDLLGPGCWNSQDEFGKQEVKNSSKLFILLLGAV
jgi:hypothetical protein